MEHTRHYGILFQEASDFRLISSSNFVRNLRNNIRSAAIYLPALDPELAKPMPVRLHHQRAVKVVSPNGLPVKCVDRVSRWGNPFEIGKDGTREEVIQKYRAWFFTGTESKKVGRYIVDPRSLRERIGELRGFNLACCPLELPRHADFLLAQANQPEKAEVRR
jgi:hypothetical protein